MSGRCYLSLWIKPITLVGEFNVLFLWVTWKCYDPVPRFYTCLKVGNGVCRKYASLVFRGHRWRLVYVYQCTVSQCISELNSSLFNLFLMLQGHVSARDQGELWLIWERNHFSKCLKWLPRCFIFFSRVLHEVSGTLKQYWNYWTNKCMKHFW